MNDVFGELAKTYTNPFEVQQLLHNFSYNYETYGETLKSAAESLKTKMIHCLEGAFVAAAILERHDYPPLVVSFESKDGLDHVVFVFQENKRWGAVGVSRDIGLQGRPAIYRDLRSLCWSYFDPYVDESSRITGYQLFHLDECGADWRYSSQNVWKLEQYLCDEKHIPLNASDARYQRALDSYFKNGPIRSHPDWW